MKRTLLPLCFLAASVMPSLAQQNFMMVNYQLGISMGDMRDYIEKNSWRGITLGYRHVIDESVAVGIDLGSQTFYEKKDLDTYTIDNASITGTQYRYSYNVPMTAKVDYVFGAGKDIRPFMGFGLGTVYSHRVTDFGLYRFTEDPWQFLMEPEIGVSVYMSGGSALVLAAKYYAAFDSKENEGQSFIGVSLGILFNTD